MKAIAITQEGQELFNTEDIVNYVCNNLLEGMAIDVDIDANIMIFYVQGEEISITPIKVSFDIKHDFPNQTTFNIELSIPINRKLYNILTEKAINNKEFIYINIHRPNYLWDCSFEDAYLKKLEIKGEEEIANLTFIGTEINIQSE